MDRAYFTRYCGHRPYDETYLAHSGIEHCIEISDRFDIRVRSVLVLGSATGRVLEHFEQSWGVKPWGCEISRWAHARTPARFRRRIARADMRDYVPELLRRGRRFDLVFSNSLVYLPAPEIPAFVRELARLGDWLHFYSSTSEDYEPGDRYRATLRPRRWWREVFTENGFRPTRSRYLWRVDASARAEPDAPRDRSHRPSPEKRRATRASAPRACGSR